mgnify:CR=1 FL=1
MNLINQVYGSLRWKKTDDYCALKLGISLEKYQEVKRQILSVKDMVVTDIMTPRTVIFKLPTDISHNEFIDKHLSSPFTRVPVYEGERDNVIGYINRNDILLNVRQTPDAQISDHLKSLFVIPSSVKVLPLFQMMIKRNAKMALVVDEYGSSEGIVTIEDIIETPLPNLNNPNGGVATGVISTIDRLLNQNDTQKRNNPTAPTQDSINKQVIR